MDGPPFFYYMDIDNSKNINLANVKFINTSLNVRGSENVNGYNLEFISKPLQTDFEKLIQLVETPEQKKEASQIIKRDLLELIANPNDLPRKERFLTSVAKFVGSKGADLAINIVAAIIASKL